MQRVFLRMGCVEITDESLCKALKEKRMLASDTEIRSKCCEVIKVISEISGLSVLFLDDIFWALGRSCCQDKILCRDNKCNKSPCTFQLVIENDRHDHCHFHGLCLGSINQSYLDYWEPQVQTSYY